MGEPGTSRGPMVVAGAGLGCVVVALACGTLGAMFLESAPEVPPPDPTEGADLRGPAPGVVARLPVDALASMVWTGEELAAASPDGRLFRIVPGADPREERLPIGERPLTGLASTDRGLVFTDGVDVRRLDGEALATGGNVGALTSDGRHAVWADEDTLRSDAPEIPSITHPSVHILFDGELALTSSVLVWTDHGAREVWARADGAVARVGAGRGAAELAAAGDAVIWREPEADLLPGRAAGLVLATRNGRRWDTRALALEPPLAGLALGEDGVAYSPGRCAPTEAERWVSFDEGGAQGPFALSGSHLFWTRPARGHVAGGLEVVRVPRAACREALENRPEGPRIPE